MGGGIRVVHHCDHNHKPGNANLCLISHLLMQFVCGQLPLSLALLQSVHTSTHSESTTLHTVIVHTSTHSESTTLHTVNVHTSTHSESTTLHTIYIYSKHCMQAAN